MTRKRITVDLRPDGTMVARTSGTQGPACVDEVERIEALCGANFASSTLTDDYELSPAEDQATMPQTGEHAVEDDA